MFIHDLPFNYQGGAHDIKVSGLDDKAKKKYIYREFLMRLNNETFRILKDGGNLVVINNPTNLFQTADLYSRFTFRNGVPLIRASSFNPAYHLGFQHNYMWFLTKGDKKTWYGNKENHADSLSDVWDDIDYRNGVRMGHFWHPQAIREDLTERILSLTSKPGDLVIDPFMGSGTTAIVCERLGRNWRGMEINKQYARMIELRLEKARHPITQLSFEFLPELVSI